MSDLNKSEAPREASDPEAAGGGPDTSAEERIKALEAENARYRAQSKRNAEKVTSLESAISDFTVRTGFEDLATAAQDFESKQTDAQKQKNDAARAQRENEAFRKKLADMEKREQVREVDSKMDQILTKSGLKPEKFDKVKKHIGEFVTFDPELGAAQISDVEKAVKFVRDEFSEWLKPTGHKGTGSPSSTRAVDTGKPPQENMDSVSLISEGLKDLEPQSKREL